MGRNQFALIPHAVWRWWRHGGWVLSILVTLLWPGFAQPVAAQAPPTCAAGTVGPRLATGTPSPLPTLVAGAKFIKQTATGAATGADWDNALGSSALKPVIESGGTVYVAAGVYAPSNVIYLGNNNTGHFVYGGFPANATGTSLAGYDPNANQTIITGSNARWLFHNVVFVQNITLQGLVLQNANGPTGSVFLGAIGDPTPVTFKFIDLLVRNNQTAGVGAFYLSAKSNPNTQILFLNSNFTGNNAVEGAAITGSGVFPGYPSSGVVNNERLVIDGVSFSNNASTSHGGAMYITGSHAWTIRNSSFCGNRTNIQGGAIYFTGAYAHKIENTSFSNNTSVAYGGAILGTSATMTINNSFFVGNQAGSTYAGGAISGHSAAFNLANSYFYNNKAGAGGAIFHVSAYNSLPSKVENSVFASNQATYPYSSFHSAAGVGGALSVAANPNGWSFINTKFVNNSVPAGGWGGAIANHDVRSTLVNALFFGNTVGTNANVAGSDIRQYDTSGGFQNIQNSKMQLSNASAYTNLLGGTHAAAYVFTTGNTFSNTDNGAVPPAPTITCPTGLPGKFGVGAPLRNFCPVSTVNLGALHIGTIPAGTTLLWSTDGDARNGLSSTSAAVTANSGTYFAYYYDATNQCYSPSSVAVNVQTTSCAAFIDTDGDTLNDAIDLDDDNDGIPDTVEAATARNNGDTDGDGIADRIDLDSDNDGILDITESGHTTGADANGDGRLDGPVGTDGIPDSVQPAPNGGAINYTVVDTDSDSRPDFQDLDSDNDGLNDVREANGTDANGDGQADNPINGNGVPGSVPAAGLTPPNTDGDGKPDFRDLDSDNDAINDVIEGRAGNFPDANGDGIVDGADTDGDGIKDGVDGTPAAFGDANDPAPTNTDNDATPDFRDPDSDNDGLTDLRESGINPVIDANNDGRVDDASDPDGDGIPVPVDGLPAAFGDANNPTLPDSNGNGTPDYRDPAAPVDTDTDGIPDVTDLDDDNDGILDTTETSTARNNGDTDGDGIADRLDLDSDNDGILDITESGRTTGADANGDGRLDGPVGTDGIPDSVQPTPNGGAINYLVADTDGDSRPDFQDLDSDNDGLNDVREANGTDANGDGQADNPINGNGVPGSVPAAGLTPPDTDGDGKPDFRDLDSDNDAINDVIEGGAGSFPDANGDGIVDGADSDGDGIKDGVDGAPATFGDANDPTPTNSDTDATPDFRDSDSDNDGLTDLRESGANPAVDANNDGKVDDITDPDNDGIPAPVDGLPAAFGDANNPTLPDSNGNGTPDYRDPAGATPTNTPVAPTATPTNTPVGPIPTATNTPVTGGTAIIGDRVWNDVNGNGVQDIGERGVPGVTVQVLAGCTGATGVVTKLTNNSGDYIIGSLPAGQYRIKVTLPAGFTSFSPKDIILDDDYDSDVNPDGISDCFTLTNGQEKYTLDAGLVSGGVPPTPSPVPTNTPVGPTPTPTSTPGGSGTATVGDRVWNDVNGNGVQDIGERGVPGVTVQVLAGCTGATGVVTKLTNNSGDYIIGSLPAGQYRIKVTLPAGFTSFSPKDIILDDDYDSDVNPDGISDCFTLTNSQEKYTLDAGLVSGGVPPTPSPVPTNTPVGPTPTPTNTPVGPTPTPAPTQPGGFICDDGICPDNDGDGIADYLDDDDDNDGIPTIDEDLNGNGNPTDDDSDGDGIPNYLDPLDSDGDTIPDLVEDANNDGNPADDDTDGDGTPDYLDLDSDNDGIPDRTEVGIRPSRPYDADRDRTPNYRDLDSDNDGKPDSSEGTASRDGDGIPDYLDRDDDGPDSGDSDNDGVPDAVECPPAALGAAFQDTDRDGIPDYMDTDTVLHYYLSLIHH